jgi:cellobiose-specific phosphotransferase system component IIA
MAGEDIPRLAEIAKKELALGADMEQIGAFALDDYQRYQAEKRILADFVDSVGPGLAVPIEEEWHKELALVGEARKDLCNNARVALKTKVEEAERGLAAEKASLEKVHAALEDVKQAQESGHALEELTSTLLEIKTLADVVQDPEELYAELRKKITGSPGDVIEAGIRDLGQYYEQVTLASHGFASFEELANYARASVQNVVHAGEALEDVYRPYQIARKDYDIPVP